MLKNSLSNRGVALLLGYPKKSHVIASVRPSIIKRSVLDLNLLVVSFFWLRTLFGVLIGLVILITFKLFERARLRRQRQIENLLRLQNTVSHSDDSNALDNTPNKKHKISQTKLAGRNDTWHQVHRRTPLCVSKRMNNYGLLVNSRYGRDRNALRYNSLVLLSMHSWPPLSLFFLARSTV